MNIERHGKYAQNLLIEYSVVVLLLMTSAMLVGFGQYSAVLPRSASVNAERELVGWQREINRGTQESSYTSLSMTPEYTHSFKDHLLSHYLFGCSQLQVQGSAFGGCPGSSFVLADYFGLPRDFKSAVQFDPVISSFIMDFDWYYGFDSWCPHLYTRIHAPIVHTTWDLHLCEAVSLVGTATFPAGYMSSQNINRADLPLSFEEATKGTTTFGDMKTPLQYGKFPPRTPESRIADVQWIVGYNWLANERAHAGLNIRISLPTGNKVCPDFIFHPVIGNGHRWECGAGFTGHVDLIQDAEGRGIMSVYLDANVTHLFGVRGKRAYDLKSSGPGSRYMLLEVMRAPSQNLLVNGTAPAYQYNSVLVPAINVTTLCSTIVIPVQVDLAIKTSFQWGNCALDLGYGLWYRSAEKVHCRDQVPDNTFALKGDAQVYGFTAANAPVPLSATQSKAALCGGPQPGNATLTNVTVDNHFPALDGSSNPLVNMPLATATLVGIAQAPVQSSNPVFMVADGDINEQSGCAPHAFTQKLFAHVGTTWRNAETWVPYLGIGAEVEFAHGLHNSGISTWGAWIKGGISH